MAHTPPLPAPIYSDPNTGCTVDLRPLPASRPLTLELAPYCSRHRLWVYDPPSSSAGPNSEHLDAIRFERDLIAEARRQTLAEVQATLHSRAQHFYDLSRDYLTQGNTSGAGRARLVAIALRQQADSLTP